MNNMIKRFFQWLFGRKQPKQYVTVNNFNKWVQFEKDVLTLINDLRDNKLEPDANLYRFAERRVEDLKIDPKSGHNGYYNSAFLLGDQGFNRTGENLGLGQTTPKGVVTGWSKSPKHNELMLEEDFKYAGVGFGKDGKKTFIVLILGK